MGLIRGKQLPARTEIPGAPGPRRRVHPEDIGAFDGIECRIVDVEFDAESVDVIDSLYVVYDGEYRFLGIGICHSTGKLAPKRLVRTDY